MSFECVISVVKTIVVPRVQNILYGLGKIHELYNGY